MQNTMYSTGLTHSDNEKNYQQLLKIWPTIRRVKLLPTSVYFATPIKGMVQQRRFQIFKKLSVNFYDLQYFFDVNGFKET